MRDRRLRPRRSASLTATPGRAPGFRFIGDFEPATIRGLASRLRRAAAAALASVGALTLVAGTTAASAQASPSLRWSGGASMPSGVTPRAVSCASESLCVAVDEQGDALTTTDPTASTPSWSNAEVDHAHAPFDAVSCAPGGTCVAVDGNGGAFVNPDPGSSPWSARASIDPGNALTGVSCPSASLCVAVDDHGRVLLSSNPDSSSWSEATSIDGGRALAGVSCASASLCVAVDDAGGVLASGEPANGGTWHRQALDFAELLGVSCTSLAAASSAHLCTAIDLEGDALGSEDPANPPATWNLTPIDLGQRLTAVSCASSGLCVAVDGHGAALASDHAAAAQPAWTSSEIDAGVALTGISCLPGGFCLAVGSDDDSFSARVPEPKAETVEAAEVSASSALLRGRVDPHDAVLSACRFEYGTGPTPGIYSQSIPCSATPAANGGEQNVSAPLSGLTPNTAYRYRIVAPSPAGPGVGGEVVFVTATSPLVAIVTPNPSIAGTPAVGQRLACHPGTPAGAAVTLTYTWLRDQIPIAGATGSTYTVQGQDSGHHLQCVVTASDAAGNATARSAFVTIPVGGVPESAGETSVGAATFANGRISVPVSCSPHASGACAITLRVQVVETLSGRRVVAVAARAARATHGRAAALRHRTITLASVRVRVAAGARQTVTASIGPSARRLLAARRRFTAYAYVTGTVVGVIEAQLARQLITLSAASHSASAHAGRRRSNVRHGRGAARLRDVARR
jgi:hypothetical protein